MIATRRTAPLEVGDSIAEGVSGSIVKRRYGLSASYHASVLLVSILPLLADHPWTYPRYFLTTEPALEGTGEHRAFSLAVVRCAFPGFNSSDAPRQLTDPCPVRILIHLMINVHNTDALLCSAADCDMCAAQ